MHLLVRERTGLDEADAAEDLGLAPADIVFLSFSDGDLAAVGREASRMADTPGGPDVRIAALARLRHPMSVDLFIERTIPGSRLVVARLLGGVDYWRYGAEELAAACRAQGVRLALLAGDARADRRLAELSDIAEEWRARLETMFREGGPANVSRALRLAGAIARGAPDPREAPLILPPCGMHDLGEPAADASAGTAVLVFYRSHLHAQDLAPLEALASCLAKKRIGTRGLYVDSPRNPASAAFLRETLASLRPDAVINATGFSARDMDGNSPFDAAERTVLQLLIAGTDEGAWAASARGLSPADLSMQIVLPELDGRVSTPLLACKAETSLGRFALPILQNVDLVAARIGGWIRLARRPRAARRIAIVLSDYPGATGHDHAMGHAVGLDTFESLARILAMLADAGYITEPRDAASLAQNLRAAPPQPILTPARYAALASSLLPEAARAQLEAAAERPDLPLSARVLTLGHVVVALQPQRSDGDRRSSYHDPDAAPCHAYVGFHLWLRGILDCDAIVQLGTHGTLEWLPGKASALSASCLPAALLGGVPVIYPFIVNNPGEAAIAKRRLGAVTIGHLTPPLIAAGLSGAAREIEALIDELSVADGLDRRRADLLRREILERAAAEGLLAEAGASGGEDRDQLAKLDAFLCDVKELRVGDGLHVFGCPPASRAAMIAMIGADDAKAADALDRSPAAECEALCAALDGHFVAPGPAGAPSRGRVDVLPTGRNLASIDPRMVPAPSALTLARRTAELLLRRHLQEEGEPLARLVLDLWGSSTLRTGGEDLAIAFVLLGADLVWDESGRLSGIEVLSLAELGRPRVDVTLRISGVFRDNFANQIALYDRAVRVIAARDESDADNPLRASATTSRVFGPAPGRFGTGARDWLPASAHAYGGNQDGAPDEAGLAALVARADAFLHQQDHHETDILDGPDHAIHEGGFAWAATALGAKPAIYHADIAHAGSDSDARIRLARDEIARVVRGRLANPAWLAGMRRHGTRGASEMARGVEALHAFAGLLPDRFDAQFDLAYAALIADPDNAAFLARENPAAKAAILHAFAEAARAGLWHPRRNDLGEAG